MTLQPDGKIVIGGGEGPNGGGQCTVGRSIRTAPLDTAFGQGGSVAASFSNEASGFNSVFVQADGKIVGVGYTSRGGRSGRLRQLHGRGPLSAGWHPRPVLRRSGGQPVRYQRGRQHNVATPWPYPTANRRRQPFGRIARPGGDPHCRAGNHGQDDPDHHLGQPRRYPEWDATGSTIQLDAKASVAGTFAYNPPAGTILNMEPVSP